MKFYTYIGNSTQAMLETGPKLYRINLCMVTNQPLHVNQPVQGLLSDLTQANRFSSELPHFDKFMMCENI